MEQRLSHRVSQIAPSATISVDTKTKAMIREGKDVVNMSVGEPDFNTPDAPSLAGIKAITNGNTRYTPAAGTLELRQAIARKLMVENGLSYQPEQIVVSAGAKHTLFNVLYTVCNPDDEVIVPAPYWTSYPEQVRLVGAVPVIVSSGEDTSYKLTPAQLEAAITPRTKAIILNSPNNPTGSVYSQSELTALGEVLAKHNIYIITDEIYERLVYGVRHFSLPQLVPSLMSRTCVVNGFSKAFAMTGWRLGYVATPLDVAKAITSMQSHSSGSPSTISQVAGVVALSSFQPEMVEEFRRRRDYLVERLSKMPGVSILVPEGAFYVFPNVSALFGKTYEGRTLENAASFCEWMLEDELVSAVPGDAFGAPANIRMSYATSYEDLVKAMDRMDRFVKRIK